MPMAVSILQEESLPNMFLRSLGWNFELKHRRGSLPNLTWTSVDNEQRISAGIAEFAFLNCWHSISRLSWANVDEDLLSQIYNFDYRCSNTIGISFLAHRFYERVTVIALSEYFSTLISM